MVFRFLNYKSSAVQDGANSFRVTPSVGFTEKALAFVFKPGTAGRCLCVSWIFKPVGVSNLFSQISQINDWPPSWVFSCIFKASELQNFSPHFEHFSKWRYLALFPLCDLSCIFKVLQFENFLLQIGQLNCFVLSWIRRLCCLVNFLSQLEQLKDASPVQTCWVNWDASVIFLSHLKQLNLLKTFLDFASTIGSE